MPGLSGAIELSGGAFVLLWYRTVVSLPVKLQPRFIHHRAFKWGAPLLELFLVGLGLYTLVEVSLRLAVVVFAVALLGTFLILKFDRYSAEMGIIYDRYLETRRANPELEELEILCRTVRWRYPQWSQDRQIELVAGKGIQDLILIMILNENKIHPISDWELYRSVKAKAARIARSSK